ncbi:hypothetical protein B0J11DRAFT_443322 [Dendryphion nanum]|uniref:N-acetyltransferase domain-containing protein n=1 Tax=Dendryphion nanum TaxID=256645 RepID=A0A9P9DBH4_9PLEO|nr:hypothetical protein B0J11DRAFT_443322 [Dendryphion nanum]
MAKILPAVSVHLNQSKSALNPANQQLNDFPTSFTISQQKPTVPVPPLTDGVRLVTAAEYKQAAACLAEAFADDDLARYFIDVPDREHWTEEEKWALHVEIMEYTTYAHILKGFVTTVGDFEAVALCGMWRLNYRLSAEGKRRFFNEFLPLLHDTKHSTLGERDDDSWYLVYIGTRPSGRGKGHCRTLVEHVTRQADRDGRLCYLESSNDVNPIIYRKFGFEDRRSIHLQRGAKNVSMDIMVREPKLGSLKSKSKA